MDVKLRRNATMIPQELQELIQGGEGITVEFKNQGQRLRKTFTRLSVLFPTGMVDIFFLA